MLVDTMNKMMGFMMRGMGKREKEEAKDFSIVFSMADMTLEDKQKMMVDMMPRMIGMMRDVMPQMMESCFSKMNDRDLAALAKDMIPEIMECCMENTTPRSREDSLCKCRKRLDEVRKERTFCSI